MITNTEPNIAETTDPPVAEDGRPTIWGLTPTAVHDRFWAARGVQVVRPGVATETVERPELYLLMAPRLLTAFRLNRLVQELSWLKPDLLWIRLVDQREHGYRERSKFDAGGNFVGFDRDYGGSDTRLARVAVTSHRRYADIWQAAPDARTGWRLLRRATTHVRRQAERVRGRCYDRDSDAETMQFMRDLIQQWQRPDIVIDRAHRNRGGAWQDATAEVHSDTAFVGPAWVGAGRSLESQTTVVGPAVLWDDPDHRPEVSAVSWEQLEPAQVLKRAERVASRPFVRRPVKRAMDLAMAITGIAVTLPLYPAIMAAIYIEDGRPFFFGHRRETLGGREFTCLKFRSMRRDAEQIKARLMAENQVDGPQFYVSNDPRITRVGRFLRKTYLDEVPQFFNVLAGHMSMVGPRPSPRAENQYCPPWREARLSVLPGITGLWQVMRTRDHDTDFQEWIRYDLEYVERGGLRMDLWIIWRTLGKTFLRR